jgi:hypothetical protein
MIKRKKGERKVLAKKEKNRKRKNWIMRAELKNVRDLRKVFEGERRVEFILSWSRQVQCISKLSTSGSSIPRIVWTIS